MRGRLPILPGSAFLPGAHHPHCERHETHLLWVFGRPLCLGCTCVAIGFVVGLVTVCMVRPLPACGLVPWVSMHALLVAPTVVQPWLQWKTYKIIARTLLGVASATWLFGALAQRHTGLWLPVEVAASVLAFAALARLLLGLRDAKTKSPCVSCPLGAYPTCSWNLPRVLNGVDDQELARALMGAVESGAVVSQPASVRWAPRDGRRL